MENKRWNRGSSIGRGSYGTVHLAQQQHSQSVFAVKSVDRSSTKQLEALESEIQILRSLSSPWVVGYLGDDSTVEAGGTWLRNLHLEYLPGGTAADLSKISGGDVDEKFVRSYTWCIASALKYVHSMGIVHCDVKGRNVLLEGAPSTSAKLADFGSAVNLGTASPVRGSPLWMAPEVIRGEHQGPESDVWSLGCTVIEMITGRPPWVDNRAAAETILQIGYSGDYPTIPTQLSELGHDFLDKCLRRDRTDRWTCDQLLQHPFISSSEPTSSISPRCVLDWLTEYETNDCVERENNEELLLRTEVWTIYGRDRIRELATDVMVIWESDGWTEVRNATCINQELEGSSEEYLISVRVGEVIEGHGSTHYTDVGLHMVVECLEPHSGDALEPVYGDHGRTNKSSCPCGLNWQNLAVENVGQHFAGGFIFLLIIFFYLTEMKCNLFTSLEFRQPMYFTTIYTVNYLLIA